MALIKNINSTPDQLVQDLKSEGNLKKLLKDTILSSLYNKSLNDNYQLEEINNFYNKSFDIKGDTLLVERDMSSTDQLYFEFDWINPEKLSKRAKINKLHFKNYFDYELIFSKLVGNFNNNFEISLVNSSSRSNIWIYLKDINKLPTFGSNVNLYRTCLKFDNNVDINMIRENNLETIRKILNHFDNYINGSKRLFIEKGIYLHPGSLKDYGFPDLISGSLYHRVTDFLQDNVGRGRDKSDFCNKFFLEILPAGVPIYFKGAYTPGVTIIRCDKDTFGTIKEKYTKVGGGSRKDYNFTRNKKFIIIGN